MRVVRVITFTVLLAFVVFASYYIFEALYPSFEKQPSRPPIETPPIETPPIKSIETIPTKAGEVEIIRREIKLRAVKRKPPEGGLPRHPGDLSQYQPPTDNTKPQSPPNDNAAFAAYKSADYEKAARLFAERSEYDKRALLSAGLAYYKAGRLDWARDYLLRSIAHEDTFRARKTLTFLYYRQDDLQESLQHGRAALAVESDPDLQALTDKVQRELDSRAGFVTERTLHFSVSFDGYEHGSISRMVIGILEDAYREVGSELSFYPDTPINVIVYTERDFHDITKTPGWTGGIYDGKIKIPIRGVKGRERLLRKVLFHEYTHALVRRMSKDCPTWINEGLAVYFSEPGMQRVGRKLPLSGLEGSFIRLRGASVNQAYSVSYSAISELIETTGIYHVTRMLTLLGEGKSLNEAFDEAFYFSYDEFVEKWGKG